MLAAAGIENPRREAELLVAAAAASREALLLHPERELSPEAQGTLAALARLRSQRHPLAYVLGEREFCALSLRAGPAAMVPRPETEILAEAAAARAAACGAAAAVDVGSGCGAIAVVLARALPHLRVVALDLSPPALRLTRENCLRHGVADRVALVCSDLLGGLRGRFDCIVANPPYVRSDEFPSLEPEVRDHEPRLALDGGGDGLQVIARLAAQIPEHLSQGGFAALEVGAGQASRVAKLLGRRGLKQHEIIPDYAGVERVVVAWREGRPRWGT
jgi:release factor glutamine methyltransferase